MRTGRVGIELELALTFHDDGTLSGLHSAVLGDKDPGMHRRPSLHETRSLSARTYVAQGLDPKVVQTLLGHSDIEMTELYLHDRGLSRHEWKRVPLTSEATTATA